MTIGQIKLLANQIQQALEARGVVPWAQAESAGLTIAEFRMAVDGSPDLSVATLLKVARVLRLELKLVPALGSADEQGVLLAEPRPETLVEAVKRKLRTNE